MLYPSVTGVKETGSTFSALLTLPGITQKGTGVSDLLRGLSHDNHILCSSLTAISSPQVQIQRSDLGD